MDAQFKKGVLELCVLMLLKGQDRYGYELIRQISAQIEISEGAVYPILRRLTREGYLSSYLQSSPEGPARKYYGLTAQGEAYLQQRLQEWRALVRGVEQLMGEGAAVAQDAEVGDDAGMAEEAGSGEGTRD